MVILTGLMAGLMTTSTTAVPLSAGSGDLPECNMWVICDDGLGKELIGDYVDRYVDRYWEDEKIPTYINCRCGVVVVDFESETTSTMPVDTTGVLTVKSKLRQKTEKFETNSTENRKKHNKSKKKI